MVQGRITKADAPTIWLDDTPSRLIGAPTSIIPTIFMPDALPAATRPSTGATCAGLHTQWLGY